MSSTRYAEDTGGESRPERHLANGKIRGLNIGMNIVCRVGRARNLEERRAMIWLVNYANLQKLTADNLSGELSLEKAYIRDCLTNPDADLQEFIANIQDVRNRFEASLPVLAPTEVNFEVSEACEYALEEHALVEIVGKTRLGKSCGAMPYYLKNLDRAIWIECDAMATQRSFFDSLSLATGIGVGSTCLKPHQYNKKLHGVFGKGFIELMFFDEFHRLWPSETRTKPILVDKVRQYFDRDGVSVVVIATPQHTERLNHFMREAPNWAPGQFEGRVARYHLPDTMPDQDLVAVAKHHAPELTDNLIELLVLMAKASEGYCGMMVETIKNACFQARRNGGNGKIQKKHLFKAANRQLKGTSIEAMIEHYRKGQS